MQWGFVGDVAANVWAQAFSLGFGALFLFLGYRAYKRLYWVINSEHARGGKDAEAIKQMLSLDVAEAGLNAAQRLFILNFVLPKYKENRQKYLVSSILDTALSLLSSFISLAIAIISGTQIINNSRAAMEVVAGKDAVILWLFLEPQEIVAVLAAAQVVVQGISKLLQLSERTLNHRFTASRLMTETWEFLTQCEEYGGGYDASFNSYATNVSRAISSAETQLLQQQGPQMSKRKTQARESTDSETKPQQKTLESTHGPDAGPS